MLIRRLLVVVYLIFGSYALHYLISQKFIIDQSILNNRIERFPDLKVQLLFLDEKMGQTKFELKEYSGEYEQLPSIEPLNNSTNKYTIDNIYFLLTTNTDRIRYTIDFLKFWLKSVRINCLIVFEENDYSKKRSMEYLLKTNEIPCQIKRSKIQRYEERYVQLIDFGWNFMQNKNQTIEWLVITDDDTIWFIDNLLKTLEQYNSSKSIYLGNLSDRNLTIQRHGDYYAYGGAGILLTKSLVSLVSNYSQVCRKKFLHMYGGDEIIGKCLTELLKINLTRNSHFYQLDQEGDIDGFFQSGIDGLVTLHHMFLLWEPFPPEHAETETEILHLLETAYEKLNVDFLKRFYRINHQKNQTLLLTNGYSFTVFNRILTKEELYQVELTWTSTQLYQRKTRPKETNKINFFFKQFNNQLRNSAIYQYQKQQIEIRFN